MITALLIIGIAIVYLAIGIFASMIDQTTWIFSDDDAKEYRPGIGVLMVVLVWPLFLLGMTLALLISLLIRTCRIIGSKCSACGIASLYSRGVVRMCGSIIDKLNVKFFEFVMNTGKKYEYDDDDEEEKLAMEHNE